MLNVRTEADARNAAERLAKLSDTLLVEEMFTDGVAEILIGVIVDAQFGQVLVLGAGGVLTEMLSDSVSLLPPWTHASVDAALQASGSLQTVGGLPRQAGRRCGRAHRHHSRCGALRRRECLARWSKSTSTP